MENRGDEYNREISTRCMKLIRVVSNGIFFGGEGGVEPSGSTTGLVRRSIIILVGYQHEQN
jgi:hypothetical protein